MSAYTQSQSVAEIEAKHPFPWREQRHANLVRLVDANNQEVILFEITALAVLLTKWLKEHNQKKEAV